MKKLIFTLIFVFLFSAFFVTAPRLRSGQAEEVTITTYYPAPEGVYDTLVAGNYYDYYDPLPNPPYIYYLRPADDPSLVVAGKVGIGTTDPDDNLHISGWQNRSVIIGETGGNFPEYNSYIGFGARVDSAAPAAQSIKKIEYGSGGATGTGGGLISVTQDGDMRFRTFNPGAGELSVNPDTAVSMAILNDGNVGIGTTDPQHSLHIYAGQTNPFKVQSSTGGSGNSAGILFNTFNTITSANARIAAIDAGSYNGDLAFYTDGDNTNNANVQERMRIRATGNVGIGTTNPEFKLSIDNDGGIIAKGIESSGAFLTTTGEGTRLIWYPRKGAFRVGRVDSDQWDDAKIGYYSFASGTFTTASGYNSTAMGNNTSASNIGSIAVGGSSVASGNFSIALGLLTQASGDQSVVIGHGIDSFNKLTNNNQGSLMVGFNSTVPTLYVGRSPGPGSATTGSVGIGTAAPGYKLTVNGQPAANGYTQFYNYSDYRLKENIKPLEEDILGRVLKLNPVAFNYNDKYFKLTGYDKTTKSRTLSGFTGQDLQKVFPEMVSAKEVGGEKYLDTNLSNLQVYLVKAIQEQQKIIEELKVENAVLKANNKEIDTRLRAVEAKLK